jgi:hypothetical protein
VLSQVPQAVRRLGRWQRCVTDGGVDAVVSVGDDQLDAAQAAAGEWKGAIPPLAAGQHDVARGNQEPRGATSIRVVCANDFCTKAVPQPADDQASRKRPLRKGLGESSKSG